MPTEYDPCADLLRDALATVTGPRRDTYGDPAREFAIVGGLWTTYLCGRRTGADAPILPHDVAAMMALLKVARLAHSPSHRDSWLDIAGYAACGHHVTYAPDGEPVPAEPTPVVPQMDMDWAAVLDAVAKVFDPHTDTVSGQAVLIAARNMGYHMTASDAEIMAATILHGGQS